jgi:hypothetical protein
MSIKGVYIRNILIAGLFIILMVSANTFSRNDLSTIKSMNSDDELKKSIEKKATELSSDLKSRINLTDNQASAIRTTLIEYLTNVSIIQFTQRAGAREKTYDVKSEPPSDLQDLNLNYDEYSLDDLRNADIETNKKLENIIPDAQKAKWNDVKDFWWSKVIAVQYEED